MTPPRNALAALAILTVAALATAQDHPNLERGFFADQAYQLSNIDSINLYNGNLMLAIPIGQTYHVGGNLSYGLTLYYNSNVWDFEQRQFYPPNPDGGCTLPPQSDPVWLNVSLPVKGYNAGLGWSLSLGALDGPYGQSDSPSWVYTSPDGSKHAFFSTLHDYGETTQRRTTSPCSSSYPCNVYYTRDNTYLRLVAIVDSGGIVQGGDIEFPDGTVHSYRRTIAPGCCTWGGSFCTNSNPAHLTQIADRFGNTLTVCYLIDGPSGESYWQLSDGSRTQKVYFRSDGNVDKVVVATFGGTTATYQFYYASATICRSCKQDDMTGYCRPMSKTTTVTLLMGVSLPDGSSYCMNSNCTAFTGTPWYNTSTSGCSGSGCTITPKDLPGTLQEVQLPTMGTVAWAYSAWPQDPAGGTCSCTPTSTCSPTGWPLDIQESAGVYQRTLCDPVGGSPCGTWTYVHESPWQRNQAGAPNEARTTVTSPNGDDTVSYFKAQACFGVDTGFNPYRPYGWDYSLPFTSNQNDGEASPNTKYLSTQFYSGTGGGRTLKRSLYVKYDSDVNYLYLYQTPQPPSTAQYWYSTNRRLAGQRTVYNDDSNTYAEVAYSAYDFVGHFRNATTGGSFGSGNIRTTAVDFNPTLTAPKVTWAGNTAWVLTTFDYQTQTESGTTAKQEFCFDAPTGALLRSRALKTGTSGGSNDALGVFTYTSGNLTSEKYYGGDTQSLSTGSLCSVSLPSPHQYRIDHTWQYGTMKSSRYYDTGDVALSFYSLDLDIDANTGFPSASRDTSGIQTSYVYDGLSRLTWEKPAAGQGAYIEHQYFPYSTSNPARIEDCAKANGVTTGCSPSSDSLWRTALRFDGLARPFLAARLLPTGTWNQQKTYRNGMEWTTAVSEWYDYGTADGSMSKTQYSSFDAFGRPGTVTLPDGKTITFIYNGERQVQKTLSIATSSTSETTATTTEVYDRQGRLYQLTEPSGTSGANVTSTYGYDVGSRLHSTSTTSGSTTQTRTFTYDNRGFLSSEQLPEKGASGNGTVTYSSYDSRGHVGRSVDGLNDVTYATDVAERLSAVSVTGGNALIGLTYATANGGGDYANGKLRTATRHNWISGADNQVVETYTYGGVGGAVSQRSTTVEGQTVSQSFTWTDLSLPSSVTYPQISGIGPARTVSATYTNGFLTAIPSYATSIAYSVNTMLSQVAGGNGVTVTYGLDTNHLPRPASIATSGAATNWSTGAYAYDGAGNIKKIGTVTPYETYVYDKVSRLTSGTIVTGGANLTQTASYDAFGFILSLNTNGSNQTFTPSSNTNRISGSGYDSAGDMTSWGVSAYGWDQLGKMQTVTGTGINHTYLYTADGERISDRDTLAGTTTLTVRGLDAKVLRIYGKSGSTWSWSKDYVYQQGWLLASVDATGTRYFALDHLGTVRRITGTGTPAQVLASHDYYPFGSEASSTTQDTERMRFTGQECDLMGTSSQTDDLCYMHARFYNPNIGRFLSTDLLRGDPSHPQAFNLFGYVRNNPMTSTDPYGLAEAGISERIDVNGQDPCPEVPQGWSCSGWYYWLFQRNPLNSLLFGNWYGGAATGGAKAPQLSTANQCSGLASLRSGTWALTYGITAGALVAGGAQVGAYYNLAERSAGVLFSYGTGTGTGFSQGPALNWTEGPSSALTQRSSTIAGAIGLAYASVSLGGPNGINGVALGRPGPLNLGAFAINYDTYAFGTNNVVAAFGNLVNQMFATGAAAAATASGQNTPPAPGGCE
jgi:RHS repeat-associated protein